MIILLKAFRDYISDAYFTRRIQMPVEETKQLAMTVYEKWALILSAIAILIPIIQWVWKKWIVQPKLNHYHTGFILIY